jgi:hypothetical protein
MMVETKNSATAAPLTLAQRSLYSDIHKDIYGVRPRMSEESWSELTKWHLDLIIEDHKIAMEDDWHRDQEAITKFVDELRIHMQYLPFGAAVRSVIGLEYEMNDALRLDEIESWFFNRTDRILPRVARKILKWSHL